MSETTLREQVAALELALRKRTRHVSEAEAVGLHHAAKEIRALLHAEAAPSPDVRGWQPIETAPKGFDGQRFHYVLFFGVSKSRSLSHSVIVSGWMGEDRRPVVNYQYALVITHWTPLPAPPDGGTPETR